MILFWGRKKTIHRDGTKLLPQRPVDLGEHAMKIAFLPVAYTSTLKFIGQTVIDCNRPVNAFNDLTKRDFRRQPIEFVPACHALVGLGDTGLGQLAQNLKCKAQRYARRLCHIFCTLFAPCQRQAIGHADCIIRTSSV